MTQRRHVTAGAALKQPFDNALQKQWNREMTKNRKVQLHNALARALRLSTKNSSKKLIAEVEKTYVERQELIKERDALDPTRTSVAIPLLLWCPECGNRHIDRGEFATRLHHTHACQECGMTWRPAVENTVGVQFLPGFKDEDDPGVEEEDDE